VKICRKKEKESYDRQFRRKTVPLTQNSKQTQNSPGFSPAPFEGTQKDTL